jgi:hypothetical protein
MTTPGPRSPSHPRALTEAQASTNTRPLQRDRCDGRDGLWPGTVRREDCPSTLHVLAQPSNLRLAGWQFPDNRVEKLATADYAV